MWTPHPRTSRRVIYPVSLHGVQPPSPVSPTARQLFTLNPRVAHLNHASFGSVPVPVQRAQQRLREEADADPMRFFGQYLPDRVARTRQHIAGFLGADPDGTVLTFNVSTGIATVLHSLALRSGDEIVVTDHSHFAVDFAVDRERRRRGVRVRLVHLPLTASDEVVTAITKAVTPGRTRLVIVAQVASATARLMPVARLSRALRAMGVPLLVDAAHAPGMLQSSVSEIDADFWVGNMHKWAFAPRGTSVLVVAAEWRDRVDPLVVSRRYTEGFPASFDQPGAFDYTGWLAAPVGPRVLRTLGHDAVRRHNAELAAYGQDVVASALQVDRAEVPAPSEGVSMSLVPLPPGVAATEDATRALRQRILDELSVEVAIHAWKGRAYLRLSAQIYNLAEEYERLAEGLPGLIRASG
jgi:isopenicillin-N epimerase